METASCFTDDLLNFSSDNDLQNDDVLSRALSLLPHSSDFVVGDDEVEEEELEWISNKDAFPMVESFVDIIPQKTSSSSSTIHFDLSPISVLETNNRNNNNVSNYNLINFVGIFNVPKKSRSKLLRKPRRVWFECWKKKKTVSASVASVSSLKPTTKSSSIGIIGRKCLHCASEKTPQWRAGPHGPKTLCNACGVRYKSGRLVPEYRPASSPTFSSEVHSNSHRKIVEMRKHKMMMTDFS